MGAEDYLDAQSRSVRRRERKCPTLKAEPISSESTSQSKGMKLMGSSPATMSPYTPCSWKMRSHAMVLLGRK